MPSIVAVLYVLVFTCSFGLSSAHAQSKSGSALDLEVRSDVGPAHTCLTTEQLRARVVHYSTRSAAPRGLRLVLYVQGPDAADLQIVRNDEVVSRRRFQQLPAACADRRDAVALSIALALDRAVEAESAATRSSTGSSTPAASSATGAGSSTLSSAATREPDAQTQTQAVESPAEAVTQPPASPQPERAQEPEGPIVLGSMPSSISHVSSRDGASPLQLHLGGRVTLEAVPMPVWVGSLGIELPISSRVTLGISALASSVGESALAGARARASFLGLEALGCAGTPLSIFMLQVCGGATLGLCTVNGAGYFRERPEATLLWAAGLARVMLRWPRSAPFAVRLLVQPQLNISRPELQVERSTARLRTRWLGASAGLELWLALP